MLGNCKIVRNNEQKVQMVLNPQGVESQTFNSLAQLPFNTVEQALDDYKQILEFTEEDSGILFKVDSSIVTSYKEALSIADTKDIEVVVFDNESRPQVIKTISSNTNPNTKVGFINNAIKNNLIEDKNYVENGVSYLQAYGFSDDRQLASEAVLDQFSKENSRTLTRHTDGRLLLSEDNIVLDTFPNLAEKIGQDRAFIETVTRGVYDNIIGKQKLKPNFFSSEESLKEQVLNLLNKVGFQITSIESYQAQYNIKHGELPNAEALVDLSNQVIAFKNGEITLDRLTEEFVHFATASLDLTDVMEEVVNTPEYAQYSEEYRDIYSKIEGITSEEVENLVRKEVVDKIIAQNLNQRVGDSNIFQKVWQKILNLFSTLSPNSFKTEISSLTDKVSDLLLSQDASTLQDLQPRKFRMFQTSSASTPALDKEKQNVKNLLEGLKQQELTLRNRGASVTALNTLIQKVESAYLRSDIASAIDLALRQVEYVEQAIEQSNINQEPLSSEERMVAVNLKNAILPLLNKISPIVENKGVKDSLDTAVNKIAKMDIAISDVIIERLIQRIMSNSNLPSKIQLNGTEVETETYLREALMQADKDTNFFFSYLGQATHARDPILNMLGKVISDMHNSVHQRWFEEGKAFANEIEALGMRPGDLAKFYDKDGYMLSYIDFNKFNQAKEEVEIAVYANHYKVTKEEAQEAIKQGSNSSDVNYQRELSKALRNLKETMFTEEFYEQRDADMANLPEIVQNKLRQISLDRSQIMRNVEYVEGVPVFTKQDRINLDALNLDRKKASNPFSTDSGNLKEGLEFTDELDAEGVPSGGYFIKLKPNPSDEALISYHLNKSTQAFIKKIKDKEVTFESGITNTFRNQLQKIESIRGREAALNFLRANVNFGLGDELFDDNYVDQLDEHFKTSREGIDKFIAYKKLISKRRNILKQYQDPKNATNTMAERMSPDTMETIKELTKDINTRKTELYKIADIEPQPFEQGKTVSAPNSSFRGMLKDHNAETDLDKRLSLTMKHVNITSTSSLYTLFQALDMASFSDKVPNFTQKQIERAFDNRLTFKEIVDNIKGPGGRDVLMQYKIQLAEQRLAPYYKSFQPISLESFEQGVENTTTPITKLLEELSQRTDVKLTLHPSYYEITNKEFENKDFNKNFKAFKEQPKLGPIKFKIGNETFEYDFKNPNFKLSTKGPVKLDDLGIPTNFANDSDPNVVAYKKLISFQYKNLELQKENIKTNVFKAPQVSRTLTNKIKTVQEGKKGAGSLVKEALNEMLNFRVDEQVQGAETDSGQSILATTGVRVIPKRLIRDLENPIDVSDDLFYSVMLMRKESETYAERQKALGTVMALEEALLTRNRADSKSVEATNTWKMFKHYVDYNIFGNSEVVNLRVDLPIIGTVDVAKFFKSLHRFLRFKNLGFKLTIPITSWLTAEVNLLLEKHIGLYLDKGSVRSARKVLMKHSSDALSESLTVNKKSHISLIGEYMDAFNLETSFRNSKFEGAQRFVGKFAFIAHTAGNYTPLTTSFLSFIIGRRIYGGEFLSYETFKDKFKANNINASSKEVDAEWNALETKSFYSYLNTANKTVEVDYNRMKSDMNFKGTEEEFKTKFEGIRNNIMAETKKFVERIDGNISPDERTFLQSHFIGQYTMTHKGWLAIAIANRLKSGHLNMNSGVIEEGTYVTGARKAKEMLGIFTDSFKRKEFKDLAKNFKDIYLKATPTERSNMQRIVKDMGLVTAIYLLMIGLRGFADDEDNQDLWALQYATYLSERVLNETKSTQFGLTEEIYKSVKEPIVGIDNILKSLNIFTLLDSEEFKSGKYQGMSKRQGWFYDNVPGAKEIYMLRSGEAIGQQRSGYEYFNNPDEWHALGFVLSSME